MNRLYLVRHCEPFSKEYNNNNRTLSDDGFKKSQELVLFFKNIEIDLIFSSPYIRAIETIKPTAKFFNKKIKEISDFRERKISNCIIDNFDEFSKRQWEDFDFKLEEGESLREVQERNINELKNIIDSNPSKNIIISGHGTSISTILNYYFDFGYEKFFELKDVMPFIAEIEFNGCNFKNYKIYKI